MSKWNKGIVGIGFVAAAAAALAYWGLHHANSDDGVAKEFSAKGGDGKSSAKDDAKGGDLGGKKGGNGGPITISTVIAKKQDYPVNIGANGTVTALNIVDIRSQVTSTIAKVHIKEGQFVRQGELLFTLDSRVDEVNLAKAKAQLEKDSATLADNQRQLLRAKELFEKKFVSQSAVDSAQTVVDAQQAVVASDKQAVVSAKVALSYNHIVAPAAGRTGVINVFPGSLVQANATALPLVTITQIDPIAVSFPLPQRNLSDALESIQRKDSFVLASLPDSDVKYRGHLQFVDNQVDAASGTVKVKAVFENKQSKLWPGAFVNVQMNLKTLKDVIVIPTDAIVVGVKGNSVYTVDSENKAVQVPVVVQYAAGNQSVVSGLAEGAKVVLEGKQNLRPGAPVKERSPDDASASHAHSGKGESKSGADDKHDHKDGAAAGTNQAASAS